MKKMQCEVCGSTEIKKIGDGIFECQSCGVQYSNDEVKNLLVEITGSVKIDHSDEVENAIKRGEQYEDAGNVTKAIQYYDRALDMDADNEEAQSRFQNALEAKSLEKYFIIEPTIDPEKNVENFLKQLATAKNIACDIYKEISIKSVTQKYNTFLFMKNNCKCDWSATICYKRYENVTVYKERYDSTLKRNVKEPVTKQVERIDRVPRSGTHSYSSDGLVFGSDAISKRISQGFEGAKASAIADFEALQDRKYGTYSANKIDARKVTKDNEKLFYEGYELDLDVDMALYKSKKEEMLRKADQDAADTITRQAGGDSSEGWSATRTILSHTVAYVCIPVQVIEYSYKGQDYVAISDLISQTTSMPLVYPCDMDLSKVDDELAQENEKLKTQPKKTLYNGIICAVIGVLYLIIAFIADKITFGNAPAFLTPSSMEFVAGVIGVFGVALIIMIVGGIQYQTIKSRINIVSSKQNAELYQPRMVALSACFEAFFKTYSDVTSVGDAAVSAKVNVCP